MPFLTDAFTVRSCSAQDFDLVDAVDYQGRYDVFRVPAGFRTDFATVPKVFSWLIPRYGIYTLAAILHDYLCILAHSGMFSRRDADGIFRRVLGELGVSWPRRWLMWAAVRAGGRFAGGMSAKETLQFLGIAVVAVPFLLIPTIVVGLWLALFWVVERCAR